MRAVVKHLAMCTGCGILVMATVAPVQGQSRRKIAITFDLAYSNGRATNISELVADTLISKLAGNSNFDVVDREYLNRIMQEQNLKVNGRFDPSDAAKLGKLANIDVLVTGRIEAYQASTANETSNGLFANKTKMNGEVELKVTSRLISVETASILAAPAAHAEKRELLAQRTDVMMPTGARGPLSSNTRGATNPDAALLSLVNKSVDEVASDLAAQIQKVVNQLPPSSHGTTALAAKVVGMQSDAVLINRGSNAGVKIGAQFVIMRAIDTGLKDPDSGQAILRKKRVCTLSITETDDSVSLGKCNGDLPVAGDEAKLVQN